MFFSLPDCAWRFHVAAMNNAAPSTTRSSASDSATHSMCWRQWHSMPCLCAVEKSKWPSNETSIAAGGGGACLIHRTEIFAAMSWRRSSQSMAHAVARPQFSSTRAALFGRWRYARRMPIEKRHDGSSSSWRESAPSLPDGLSTDSSDDPPRSCPAPSPMQSPAEPMALWRKWQLSLGYVTGSRLAAFGLCASSAPDSKRGNNHVGMYHSRSTCEVALLPTFAATYNAQASARHRRRDHLSTATPCRIEAKIPAASSYKA